MGTDLKILSAISPLDGRYRAKLEDVSEFFSEYALMRYRVIAEFGYFYQFTTKILHKKISEHTIRRCIDAFDEGEAEKIKVLEKKTNHDVKAVEYYIREKLQSLHVGFSEYVHFGLTSEDINSIAYGLSIAESRNAIVIPAIRSVISSLMAMAKDYASIPMVARTHGQAAVPTTVGKELIVFAVRLGNECGILKKLPIEAKITGAVGNYNAHIAGFPEEDWMDFCDSTVSSFGLTPNHCTTQILPADSTARLFQSMELLNTILIGLTQDMWRYISDGYFTQNLKEHEVGSSTMPQKVNPIDFENAEGNLGLANALFSHFITKLPVSRLQRDLSDSTVKRNIGSAFAYSVLGYRSCVQGLQKLSVHKETCEEDLLHHWEMMSEGMQTIMRIQGDVDAYETIKKFTRGKTIDQSAIQKRLLALTPLTYTGLAEEIVKKGIKKLQKEGFS
jgi:adenylosuccinate lyase